jgi:hypothetical protein
MGQKEAEQWAAAVDLQPTTSKSSRLLEAYFQGHTGKTKNKKGAEAPFFFISESLLAMTVYRCW